MDGASDLQLLFGVLGGGDVSGASGTLIKQQLQAIVNEINKNPMPVNIEIRLGGSRGGQQSWATQLRRQLNEASNANKFAVNVSKLNLTPQAISNFRQQLASIVNTLSVGTGTSITFTGKGIGTVTSQMKELSAAAREAVAETARFKAQNETLNSLGRTTRNALNTLDRTSTTESEREQIRGIVREYEAWDAMVKELQASKKVASDKDRAYLEQELEGIRAKIQALNDARAAVNQEAEAQKAATAATVRAQTEALNALGSPVKSSLTALDRTDLPEDERVKVDELIAKYEAWNSKVKELQVSKRVASQEEREALAQELSGIQAETAALNEFREAWTIPAEQLGQRLDALGEGRTEQERAEIKNIRDQYEDWLKKVQELRAAQGSLSQKQIKDLEEERDKLLSNVTSLEKYTAAQKQRNSILKETASLLKQVQDAQRNWTKASIGKNSTDYANLAKYSQELQALSLQLRNGSVAPDVARRKLAELNNGFIAASGSIEAAGKNTKSFGDRIVDVSDKFGKMLTRMMGITMLIREIRQMVTAVKELDAAMTQLRIVTRTTEAEYEKYMTDISQTATRIGSSITDLIDSTTTYARLGYSIDEASQFAEYTAMLQNVGDINVSDAQDALTAIFKAFDDVDVNNIETVMDKLVKTGKLIARRRSNTPREIGYIG